MSAIEPFGTAEDGCPLHWKIGTPPGSSPKPWILLIHGGNWNSGSISLPYQVCAPALIKAGFIVASIEYRLAPRNPLPGQVTDGRYPQQDHDVELAATTAKADPRCSGRVIAVGGSAGGSHAIRLAAKGLVDKAVGMSPAMQFDDPQSLLDNKFRASVTNYAPDHFAEASPNSILTSDEPPVFIAAYTDDNMPAPQYLLGVGKLAGIGAVFDSILLSGVGHSFDMWPIIQSQVITWIDP